MRRAVTDPRGDAAVQVQGGPVVSEAESGFWIHPTRWIARTIGNQTEILLFHPVCVWAETGTHNGGVDGNKEVPALSDRKLISEQDAHGPIPLRQDRRTEVVAGLPAQNAFNQK
jgi:hypothetical protein